ncbi:uncharacterized protein LOC129228113 [Uloborus diversus]|uniref:uncharacterized protein LOC129228113 n=1 Tax=Uloborus diversus TaxID=327109 RepID=UPI0024099CDD|nr:uncharacterized protein LOC129228113 [Uloborus diversus]
MVVKSIFGSVISNVYNIFRSLVDTAFYIILQSTIFSTMVLNAALSLLVLFEEIAIICLLLPWIPAKRIGSIFGFIRKLGFPEKITLSLYIVMVLVVMVLNLIALELHYLQLDENLLSSFDEFRNNLFTSLKLFVVMHRFLHLLSNEASLRKTCKLLKKRLKIEQDEELDEKDLGETVDDDTEVDILRGELERTRLDLEAMKLAYATLQEKIEKTKRTGTG